MYDIPLKVVDVLLAKELIFIYSINTISSIPCVETVLLKSANYSNYKVKILSI